MLKTMWAAVFVLGGLMVITFAGCGNGDGPKGGAASSGTTAAKDSSGEIAWNALVDQYFDQVYFKFAPTAGTSAGLHHQ